MAEIIVRSAEHFRAQSQIQSQIGPNLPVVLRKEAEVVGAVFVVEDAAAAEAEVRSAEQEILEVGCPARSVHEKELAVEGLRKELVEITRVYSPPKRKTCAPFTQLTLSTKLKLF